MKIGRFPDRNYDWISFSVAHILEISSALLIKSYHVFIIPQNNRQSMIDNTINFKDIRYREVINLILIHNMLHLFSNHLI